MNELAQNLKQRVDEATSSLRQATATGDDYLAEVRVGELQELRRLAGDHDIAIEGIDETIEAHPGAIETVDITDAAVGSARADNVS